MIFKLKNTGAEEVSWDEATEVMKLTLGEINIGKNSVSGGNSVSLGLGANASSTYGVAIGPNTIAGSQATALGWHCNASGYLAFAAGRSSIASAANSIAIGYGADATEINTVAIGMDAQATNDYGVALGAQTRASGQATALGFQSDALGYRSVAIGAYAYTTTANRIQLGTSSQHVYCPGSLKLKGSGGYIDYSEDGYVKWTAAGVHYWRFNWYSSPNSQVEFRNLSNDNKCTIKAMAYSNISDDRVKINEKLIENATETLMKLRPQTYEQYGNMDCSGETHFQAGLIAQEVHYQAPELRDYVINYAIDISVNDIQDIDINSVDVQNDPDYEALGWGKTESSLNYIGFIPYLIKSNQEQQEEINTLKSQITDLLARVSSLESA